jgi:hypothetical protein
LSFTHGPVGVVFFAVLPVENPVDVPGSFGSFEDLKLDSVGEVQAAMSAAAEPREKRRGAGFTL